MICEILSVGTELLLGQIANTDAQFLARRLSELGIFLYRTTVVGDNPARLRSALEEALSRSDLVITTGGLGPTADDLTKETVAEYLGLPLVRDEESLSRIRDYLSAIGRPMAKNNEKQADLPKNATILPNECGTAPGCLIQVGSKSIAILPGPPHELEDMFDRALKPILSRMGDCVLYSRYLRIFGIGESMVENQLAGLFDGDNPTLALYCGAGEVKARLTARGATQEEAQTLLLPLETEIRCRLGKAVYSDQEEETLADTVYRLLDARGETVCFAESLTGGRLCAQLVDIPGASRVLEESYITYSNESKERILGVTAETLARSGAVSEACAREMAQGARRVSGADWGVSVTGIAGPDGGTTHKPVGLVYIGISSPQGTTAYRCQFRGNRDWIRTLTCSTALDHLRLAIEEISLAPSQPVQE